MAIEGAPRLPDDRDKLTDSSDVAESTPQVQPPDAWQQFKDRIFGPKPEVDPDKNSSEEEDEDEDDESGEATTVKGKSKSSRFRRALRGLIAQKAEVPEDEDRHGAAPEESASHWPTLDESATEHDWQVAGSDESDVLGEQSPVDYETPYVEHDELPEVTPSYDDAGRGEVGDSMPSVEVDNPAASQVLESEQEPPAIEGLPTAAAAAPEDLRTILERQHHLRADQTTGEGVIDRTASGSGVIFESGFGATTRQTERVIERADNTAGLLAVDLLNYGVAKHRDKKINKAAIARDKDLDERMQKGDRALEEKMLQQQRAQRELERQLQKKEHALSKVRHGVEFPLPADNNRERIANKVVENTTQERTDFLSPRVVQNFEVRSSAEKPIVAIPDIALPSAETIMHRVETAAEKGVPIETEYELRHERKGNNDYSALEEAGAVVDQQLQQTNLALQQFKSLESAKSAQPTDRKVDEYKQAVASGAWGAVVGVLLFVAYIVLTK